MKRGRPPLGETAKNRNLNVRVTTEELETIRRNAKKRGVSISEFLRMKGMQK